MFTDVFENNTKESFMNRQSISRRILLNLPFVGLMSALLMPSRSANASLLQDDSEAPNDLQKEIQKLTREIKKLKDDYVGLKELQEGNQKRISLLSLSDSPVGSVVAYSGTWTVKLEEETNWLLCDGRAMKKAEHKELFDKIGTANGNGSYDHSKKAAVKGYDFNIPMLGGVFLRGVDITKTYDLDRDRRQKPNGNKSAGNQGNLVGSFQSQATAPPKNTFKTNGKGGYNYNPHAQYNGLVRGADHAGGGAVGMKKNKTKGAVDVTTTKALDPINIPDHEHEITDGGDKETRPVNVSVYWIIKARTKDKK